MNEDKLTKVLVIILTILLIATLLFGIIHLILNPI